MYPGEFKKRYWARYRGSRTNDYFRNIPISGHRLKCQNNEDYDKCTVANSPFFYILRAHWACGCSMVLFYFFLKTNNSFLNSALAGRHELFMLMPCLLEHCGHRLFFHQPQLIYLHENLHFGPYFQQHVQFHHVQSRTLPDFCSLLDKVWTASL